MQPAELNSRFDENTNKMFDSDGSSQEHIFHSLRLNHLLRKLKQDDMSSSKCAVLSF